MIRVAVIGAGSLGRRHLVSLATLGEPVSVLVHDPSERAHNAAQEAFAGAGFGEGSTLETRQDIKERPEIDVAIVATNSRERPIAVEQALSLSPRAVLLEKVLFTRLADYDRAEAAIEASGARVFVNCVRRTYSSFPELQALVNGRPFSYRVNGEGWGLACNLVHHLDEFAALTGTTDISIDTSSLDPGYIPSKRAGYVEFVGRVQAQTADGSTFEAICREGPSNDRSVTVETPEASAVVTQQSATFAVHSSEGARTTPIDIPLQSRITAEHVRALLTGRAPALPDYNTAAAVHRPMIAAFLNHLRRTRTEETFNECPIT